MRLPFCDSTFVLVSAALSLTACSCTLGGVWLFFGSGEFTLSAILLVSALCSLTVTNFVSLKTQQQADGVCSVLCALLHQHVSLLAGNHTGVSHIRRQMSSLLLVRLCGMLCGSLPALLCVWYYGLMRSAQFGHIHQFMFACLLLDVCFSLAAVDHSTRCPPLLLSWPAVIIRLLWRLGSVLSRVSALSLYALVHGVPQLALLLLLHTGVCLVGYLLFRQSVHNAQQSSTCSKQQQAAMMLPDDDAVPAVGWAERMLLLLMHTGVYVEMTADRVYRLTHITAFYALVLAENVLITILVNYPLTNPSLLSASTANDPALHILQLLMWLAYAWCLFFLVVYHQFCQVSAEQVAAVVDLTRAADAPTGTYFYRNGAAVANRGLPPRIFHCQLPFSNLRPALQGKAPKQRSQFVMPPGADMLHTPQHGVWQQPQSEPTPRKSLASLNGTSASMLHSHNAYFDSRPPEAITTLPKNIRLEFSPSPESHRRVAGSAVNRAFEPSSSSSCSSASDSDGTLSLRPNAVHLPIHETVF